MNTSLIIISLSILFFLGHILNWFFIKTKVPDLLILIILGILLGPMAFNLIDPEAHLGKTGAILGVVTLIVILYEGGLHLSFKDLVESSLSALSLSLLSFFSIAFLSTLILLPFLPFTLSLLVGLGVGSTSSAIVIPMVKPLAINKQSKTILSLESAFTDVLTIVSFLALLEYISNIEQGASGGGGGAIFLSLSSTPIASVAIGALFAIAWSVLRKHTDISSIPFAGESVALLTYGVLEFQSLNGALGVLSLGFTLANTNLFPSFIRNYVDDKPVSDSELSLLNAITFLLRTFFFVYLGLLIQISGIFSIIMAMLITLFIFITRYICVRLIFNKNQFSLRDAITSTAMGPRGLACAVLATLPLQKGIEEGEMIQNLIFSIIPFSILATSIFVSLTEKPWFKNTLKNLYANYLDKDNTNNIDPKKDSIPFSSSSSENKSSSIDQNKPI